MVGRSRDSALGIVPSDPGRMTKARKRRGRGAGPCHCSECTLSRDPHRPQWAALEPDNIRSPGSQRDPEDRPPPRATALHEVEQPSPAKPHRDRDALPQGSASLPNPSPGEPPSLRSGTLSSFASLPPARLRRGGFRKARKEQLGPRPFCRTSPIGPTMVQRWRKRETATDQPMGFTKPRYSQAQRS